MATCYSVARPRSHARYARLSADDERTRMSWLVTGGAGYIGAHVVRAFEDAGLQAVVLDDLSSGHRDFVRDGTPFVEGTILDTDLVSRTCKEHEVDGVVHLAGFKYAGVSVQRPLHTYNQNVVGTV